MFSYLILLEIFQVKMIEYVRWYWRTKYKKTLKSIDKSALRTSFEKYDT